jgi:hypothetical protein
VAGDGGQYALRDFLCYVGSVEIIIFSFFLGKVGKQTNKQKKKKLFVLGPFCDR